MRLEDQNNLEGLTFRHNKVGLPFSHPWTRTELFVSGFIAGFLTMGATVLLALWK